MNLPLDSKLWIFQSTRNFNAEELQDIQQTLENFMLQWNAHGAALNSAYAIPYNRFIVIVVDENQAEASGCSIDSMTRVIKAIEEKYNFGLLNRMLTSYKHNDEIITLPLNEFKQKVKNRELAEDTIVFHNGLVNLGDYQSQWESPLAESWAKIYLN